VLKELKETAPRKFISTQLITQVIPISP